MMRSREERRLFRQKQLEKCKRVLESSGFKQGTLYNKHVEKIEDKGFGYMSKHGNMLHYIRGTNKKRRRKSKRIQNKIGCELNETSN